MRLRFSNRCASARQSGSVLLVTVFLAAILGLSIGYYLWWVRSENLLVAESQAWNSALAHAEAGIEEGLAQVNVSFGTNYTASALANWGSASPGVYGPRSGSLSNGSFSVVLIASASGPALVSTGFAPVPFTGRVVARTVQVTTVPNPLFAYALGAGDRIIGAGHSLATDSFDSADPGHSTGGLYSSATRLTHGDVAAALGLTNTGTVQVNGLLCIGAGGSANLGRSGFAGAKTYDFNQQFRPVPTPNISSFVPPLLHPTSNQLAVLGNGNFKFDGDLNIDGGQSLDIAGNAVVYVGGNINMAGSPGPASQVHILSGGSLELYVNGSTATLNQVVVDAPDSVARFRYFGLPSNTNLSWTGNSRLLGVIYAPQANITLDGPAGGRVAPTLDFQGSCIGRSVILNQKFQFHYDQALRNSGSMAGFVVTSWREL